MQKPQNINCDSVSEALPTLATVRAAETAYKAEWYALQTRPQYEKKVSSVLRMKGVETFLPMLREIHRWSDREKTIHTALFSGYTFTQIALTPENKKTVLLTEGVIGFVNSGGATVPVPSKQIEDLRQLLSAKVRCALAPFLNTGQRVRVRGGSLDGIEGIVAQSDSKHLTISVELINRSITVEIQGYELELI